MNSTKVMRGLLRTGKSGIAQTLVREPAWTRYLFAFATAGAAIGIKLAIDQLFQRSLTPYLPAIGAVMVSAALTGFGGGVVTTVLITFWALFSQPQSPPLDTLNPLFSLSNLLNQDYMDTAFRCGILFFEGLLISAGFARRLSSMHSAARSELWHRKLLATAAEGIWVVGPESKIAFANPRIAQMLGYEPSELNDTIWESFFFFQDLPMERIRHQNFESTASSQFDRRMRRKDGSELWVLACVNSFTDEFDGHCGYLAMMTDITERKSAEVALRRSETRFRGLFENVLEGVYQSTPDGRILAANPMLLRMIGVQSEAELTAIDITRDLYLDPVHRLRILDILEHEGQIQNAEFLLRRPDGTILHVLENARAIRDDGGQISYYEGTLIDLTPKALTHLSRQPATTQSLLGESISRASERIAQDFNNTLTVISGHLELALCDLTPNHPARIHINKILCRHGDALTLAHELHLCNSRRRASDETANEIAAERPLNC